MNDEWIDGSTEMVQQGLNEVRAYPVGVLAGPVLRLQHAPDALHLVGGQQRWQHAVALLGDGGRDGASRGQAARRLGRWLGHDPVVRVVRVPGMVYMASAWWHARVGVCARCVLP